MKKRLLLHVCCAPCSAHAIEILKKDYNVTLFFSNSNIYPREEYERRLENARKIAAIHNLDLVEDAYDSEGWMNCIKGLEPEPEKGKRCIKCFEFNLMRAAAYSERNSFDFFTTTLTISPHKDSKAIIGIGKSLGNFLAMDFKKQDGFRDSAELSKKYNIYRQNYCGCRFSMQDD